MGLDVRRPVLGSLLTIKAQTSLRIRAFVIRFLKTIISRLATSKIAIFLLVSEAEQAGLSLALSETQRQVLLRQGPYDNH